VNQMGERSNRHVSGISQLLLSLAILMALGVAALYVPPPALAEFGIRSFESQALDAGKAQEIQAGAHPFQLSTEFYLNETSPDAEGAVYPDGNLKDVVASLPAGLVGNPTAVPECPRPNLASATCSPASQVGIVTFREGGGFLSGARIVPLYNMVPRRGEIADFATLVVGVPVHIVSALDAAHGYRIQAISLDNSQALETKYVKVTVWGVPADPAHDPFRGPYYTCLNFSEPYVNEDDPRCLDPRASGLGESGGVAAGVEPAPFLTMPTHCGAQLESGVRANSWLTPELWSGAVTLSEGPMTGCDKLEFRPSVEIRPDVYRGDSPVGLSIDVEVPQRERVGELATPTLRKAVVTLPPGLVVNPSSADGLGSCSEAQIGLGSNDPGTCLENSKLGTVEIATPVLDHPLKGSVYLASPHANPFGTLLALYMEVVDPVTGIDVKLPGKVEADPVTGQLTSTFDETPQLPFSNLHLQLKSGPRAALRTPATCGSYTTTSSLTPWSAPQSGPPATPSSSFQISQGAGGACPSGALPNSTSLESGTTNASGGSYSPFVLRLSRPDGSQELSAIEATLPKGLLARLAGTPYCPDAALAAAAAKNGRAEQASPSCPAASRVGSVRVGAGAGSSPIQVAGSAYLAGPYKGAPLSLAIVTPAVAGPFDLGTVVVRNALWVDPVTAQVSVKSDPIPTILEGIPLDIRTIEVTVDKPQFTLNPTNCEPMTLAVSALGTASAASLASPFQAVNCERLEFKPKLQLSLKGGMKRSGNPALTAVLTQPKGENANIARTQVTLPKTMFIDNAHINSPCTRVQFNADACPPKSILGTATAYSPLLDKPLSGPVYFRSNGGERELPDLVADLNGQIHVILVGFIDSVRVGKESSRVRTRFQNVPDAPVSRFVLKLKGGRKGLIENSVDLCKTKPKATLKLVGQNGKASEVDQAIGTSCRGKKKGKGKKR
jgi:hypothetical protein